MSKKKKTTTLEVAMQQETESEFVTIRRGEYDMLNWSFAMLDFILSIRDETEMKEYERHDLLDRVLSLLGRAGERDDQEGTDA